MIPEICACFAEADRKVAETIAARLEDTAEVRVWLEQGSPANEIWDRGLGGAGVVLLLSPDFVPPRLDVADWKDLLTHVQSAGAPPVVTVEVRDCRYPQLLRRRRFAQWSDPEAPRFLHRWAMSLHGVPEPPPFVPAPVPGFVHDARELWAQLVDRPGIAEAESTDIAQQFAHAASPYFRDVLWVACARRSPACIAGEIATLLGLPLDGPEEEAFRRSLALARKHRVLLVLDGLEPEFAVPVSEGPGSILMTRRCDLPRAGGEAPDSELFEAMCTCVPGAFPLELPAAIAGISRDQAVTAADRLVAQGLIVRLDPSGSRLRLRARAHPRKVEALRSRHAAALHASFTRWSHDPVAALRLIPEVEIAIRWAVMRNWPVAGPLALSAAGFLRDQNRATEAAFILDILLWAARDRGDKSVAETCEWELSWLRGGVDGAIRTTPQAIEQMSLGF